MREITFLCGGRELTAAEIQREAAMQPRQPKSSASEHKTTHKRDEAKLSLGFIVLGRPADYMDTVRKAYETELSLHEEKPKEVKHPGMLDDFARRWKMKNKPARISRRPYSLEDAAKACAELAKKSGWVEVEVEEVLKT